MKFSCNWPSSFREEVVLNCGRTDDGRTTEASHPISSPGAFGSGELKIFMNVVCCRRDWRFKGQCTVSENLLITYIQMSQLIMSHISWICTVCLLVFL